MKLTPLADRVILKMVETEETTKGGITRSNIHIFHNLHDTSVLPAFCHKKFHDEPTPF